MSRGARALIVYPEFRGRGAASVDTAARLEEARGLALAIGLVVVDAIAIPIREARAAMKDYAIHAMLADIWGVVADANRYFASQEPWALRKTDPARMNTVLYALIETLRRLALLCHPFMPGSMTKLLDQLGVPADARSFANLEHALMPGIKLPAPQGIFPRFVEAAPEGKG